MKAKRSFVIVSLTCLLTLFLSPRLALGGEETAPFGFEYVPDSHKPVVFMLGRWIFKGYVDQYGNLTPDLIEQPVLHPAFGGSRTVGAREAVQLMQSACNYPNPKNPGQRVYEYRSGSLISGHLGIFGFVPAPGKKVISFDEYQYRESGPRIYNLPGEFVKKGK